VPRIGESLRGSVQCTEPRVPRLRRRSGLHVGVRRDRHPRAARPGRRLCLAHRNDLTAWEAFGLIIPAAFLTTPYLWSYDQILYLIPVVWIAVRLVDRTRGYVAPFIFMTVLVLGSIVGPVDLCETRSDLASLLTTGLVAASALS